MLAFEKRQCSDAIIVLFHEGPLLDCEGEEKRVRMHPLIARTQE
jgi:hypothetical protein